MSEAAVAPAGDAPPSKKGKLVIILVAVLALLAGAGGGAFFMLSSAPAEAEVDDDGSGTATPAKKKKRVQYDGPPVYLRLDPLTVNLADPGNTYLAANIELQLAEPPVGEVFKLRAPEIRNLVLMTVSSQTPDTLVKLEGKQELATTLRSRLNELIGEDEETGVVDVFFTQFIMQ